MVLYCYLDLEPGITWSTGPDGISVPNRDYTNIGDVIQYNWDDDGIWDHSVIIVGYHDPEWDNIPLIASHDEDHYNYPHSFFTYNSVRFIHIRWNRGVRVFLSLVFSSNNGLMDQSISQDPYPPPNVIESTIGKTPYPAP